MAARSKAWVCRRSLAGVVGWNPARGMDVCVVCRVRTIVWNISDMKDGRIKKYKMDQRKKGKEKKSRVSPCGFCGGQSGIGTRFFSEYFGFPPVNFIPPVLHDTEKRKKLIIFIADLHNKL